MAEVHLWSGLRRLADGQEVLSVEAKTLREMLDALIKAHPGLEPAIKGGITLSVDGAVETNLAAPLRPQAEVYLLQRMKGG